MNRDSRWEHFHNAHQLTSEGMNFVLQFNLLDDAIRGEAFMFPDQLRRLMDNVLITDHDRFLIELYCSNYNPHELHPELNALIDQLADVAINEVNSINVDQQNSIDQQRRQLMDYIRRIHSSRSNVDPDSASEADSMVDSMADFDIDDIHELTNAEHSSFEE